jgi:hypothetical protein
MGLVHRRSFCSYFLSVIYVLGIILGVFHATFAWDGFFLRLRFLFDSLQKIICFRRHKPEDIQLVWSVFNIFFVAKDRGFKVGDALISGQRPLLL